MRALFLILGLALLVYLTIRLGALGAGAPGATCKVQAAHEHRAPECTRTKGTQCTKGTSVHQKGPIVWAQAD